MSSSLGRYTLSFDIPNKPHIEPAIFHMDSIYIESKDNPRPMKRDVKKKSEKITKQSSNIRSTVVDDKKLKVKGEEVEAQVEEPKKKRKLRPSESKFDESKQPKHSQTFTKATPAIDNKEVHPRVENSPLEDIKDDFKVSEPLLQDTSPPIESLSQGQTAPQFETKVTLARPVKPISLHGDLFSVTFSPLLSGFIYDDYFQPTDNILYDHSLTVSTFIAQNPTEYGYKLEEMFNRYFESHLITSNERNSRGFKLRIGKTKQKKFAERFPLIYFLRFLICMTKVETVDPNANFNTEELRKFQESLRTLCDAIEKRAHHHENKLA